MRKNKGRNNNFCGICGQETIEETNVAEFKIGRVYQTGDVGFHGQETIKCNTKVFDSHTWEMIHCLLGDSGGVVNSLDFCPA